MSTRIVRHLGSRSCPADTATVLMAVPTFPGEKLMGVHMDGYFASGVASAIDQPGELNWYGITLPWQLAFTTSMLDTGSAVTVLGGVPAFDLLFQEWLKGGDDEYWGGDVNADPEIISGEEGHDMSGANGKELIHSGPIGVSKWFVREKLMIPLAAEGNTVIRFGDSFTASPTKINNHAMGSLHLFGIVRHEFAAETNINIELDDATSKEGMGLLLAGDYTKVKAKVEEDTGALGDFLRTVLYGGDNYIEADTLKGPAGKGHVKATFVIQTSMGREHA